MALVSNTIARYSLACLLSVLCGVACLLLVFWLAKLKRLTFVCHASHAYTKAAKAAFGTAMHAEAKMNAAPARCGNTTT